MNEQTGGILLAAINAKWIHPSLALRLLKANLGPLEKSCSIIEFALRQPLSEKVEPIIAARPRILGISVSIWNHTATRELLKELHPIWSSDNRQSIVGQLSDSYQTNVRQLSNDCPIIVLGGPEVSYLPRDAEIFQYADYCIVGEGEIAFRELCESIFENGKKNTETVFIDKKGFQKDFQHIDVTAIKSAYHLYRDEDGQKKLIYVEASRGCPFRCEFCLSGSGSGSVHSSTVREFPLEPFLAEMNSLIHRGAKTFKFLDRTFNLNIDRARRIMEFFLEKIAGRSESIVVHFEMVPSRFPPELIETIARFPSGTLRLEIGIQTLNPDVSALIGRPSNPKRELAAIRLLREKTNAIIHADLIAGLPSEDARSLGRGFDALYTALFPPTVNSTPAEIQLGILKLLPGTSIARHTIPHKMRYNPLPPYEVTETADIPARDLDRLKNFARFWEIIVNRGLYFPSDTSDDGSFSVFDRFMAMSDTLLAHFGRNWGIDKHELKAAVDEHLNYRRWVF